MVFPSGYAANLGWVQSLVRAGDVVVYDEYSHTSFRDGLSGRSGIISSPFRHNDIRSLVDLLTGLQKSPHGDVFLPIEGLYSMDGDTAPLLELKSIAQQQGVVLVVDDAHGTGVLGTMDEERIRISLTASHNEANIDELQEALSGEFDGPTSQRGLKA